MGEKEAPKGGEYGSVYKPPEAKKGFAAFRAFLWNSERKEFLGRTASSWGKITLFYLIFYACLAAVFAVFLAIFLQTLDETNPKWQGANGLIGANPGLGFRPAPPDEHIDSTLIWFVHGKNNPKGWEHWADELGKFLVPYEKGRENAGQFLEDCSFSQKKSKLENVCFFDVKKLGDHCYSKNNFGYEQGSPCVFVKLNRIYGWKPEPYNDTKDLPPEMPEQLKQEIRANAEKNGGVPDPMVWLSCEGENPADKENVGKISFIPMQGFPAYYFPYLKTPGYLSPFVAVHFHAPEPGVLINIECKGWAKNIRHDRMDRIGLTHFELLMD